MDSTILEAEAQARRRLEFENDKNPITACIDDESEKLIHGKISKAMVSMVGMEFESEDVAYGFYNAYAREIGFSVRKSKSHGPKEKVIDRKFVCSCEGKRGKDKRDDLYKSHRPETRFGCLAMLKICRRPSNKYNVVSFVPEHNHVLASPSKAHLFRSHRTISVPQAANVEMADLAGIAPKNAFELMAKQAGGRESLGFARMNYNNYLQSKRNPKIKPGETKNVLGYLQTMQTEDPNFFYAIQLDEDDLIANIFWADAKMVSDYADFGDVVCFDTTYRKHKDGRPIALFVGENHHKKTIVFGVALLYDETADSFIWLFDTFVKAMGGKFSVTMITDQDAAMSTALAHQWPGTFHRLCIWHIFQNATIHLSSVFEKFQDFSTDFKSCVYDHVYEEDFLKSWDSMLQKYDLHHNDWLKRLFKIKKKWALVYGRDTFCAGMLTTQRSESMNKVIKHYVSPKHDLPRFFEHFQRLLDDRRYDEMVADFKASQSKVVLSMPVELLKHAASVYTPKVFTLFQAELCKAFDCLVEKPCAGEIGEVVKYVVKPVLRQSSYVVSYDKSSETISCTCRNFEFAGLLCSHILKIYSDQGIIRVPQKYVLKRWTKDAKKGSVRVANESCNDLDPKVALEKRYRDLCRLSTHLSTRVAESEEAYNLVKESLINLCREIDFNLGGKHLQSNPKNCQVVESDPRQLKTVESLKLKPKPGHRSSKRPKGPLEKPKRSKRGKKKTLPDDGVQTFIGSQVEQVNIDADLTHMVQGSSSQVPVLQNDQINSTCQTLEGYDNFDSNNIVEVSRMNVPDQQNFLLPFLQQCDAYDAYAKLLQTSDM